MTTTRPRARTVPEPVARKADSLLVEWLLHTASSRNLRSLLAQLDDSGLDRVHVEAGRLLQEELDRRKRLEVRR